MTRAAVLLVAAGASACSSSPAAPTYEQDVAPIFARECTKCHYEGGIAPFPLLTFEHARANAAAIQLAVKTRVMPPYGVDNSGACNTFAGARWLQDAEIDAIDHWVSGGMERGAGVTAKRAAPAPALLNVTATLDMGFEYTPRTELGDDYRCFLVDPAIAEDQFLTAYEVIPGNARIVHHVILYSIDDQGGASLAVRLDEEEPGPGYTCFGASGLSIQSSRVIAGWAPGTGVTRYPENTGVRLHGTRMAIMQIHYNTKNGAGPDRTRIDLELQRAVDKPAEILGVADLGLSADPGLELFTTEPIQITPGVGGFIRGVFPHMHKLGRKLSSRIVHTDESAKCLTEVPAWDFAWQQFYFFEEPIYVLGSDRIELTCGYDTRTRSEAVRWGEGTDEEMCLLGLYVTLN